MKAPTIILGVCILIVGIVFSFFYFGGAGGVMWNSTTSTSTPTTSPAEIPGSGGTRVAPAGAREYQSTKYLFSVLYPDTLAVREFDEGGGATTITFQNPGEAKGFQIFITPYSKTQVDDQKFREDIPSGVMKESKETVLDGTPVTTFVSEHALLGETREVWFIKDGYLYEITTLKPLEGWLESILLTWKFI